MNTVVPAPPVEENDLVFLQVAVHSNGVAGRKVGAAQYHGLGAGSQRIDLNQKRRLATSQKPPLSFFGQDCRVAIPYELEMTYSL